MEGMIFNVQHYCIHDGPGVRTTVFFKGCPLRCRWCANPESQSGKVQLMVREESCTGCGACTAVCPEKAVIVENGKSVTDRTKCMECGACTRVCEPEARVMMGRKRTLEDILAEVEEDSIFYGDDGGVTLSGGEVLAQPDFAAALLKACRDKGLHTAVETTGFAGEEVIRRVLGEADLILYDCKHMDSKRHQWGTGVGNEQILKNLVMLSEEMKKKVILRIPLIHEYNDSRENLEAVSNFLKTQAPSCREIHLLPYHNLGEGKKAEMGWNDGYYTGAAPEKEQLEDIRKFLREQGFRVPD